jgi:hypothetical protein
VDDTRARASRRPELLERIRFDNCNSPYVAGRQLKIGRVYFGQKWYQNDGTLHIPN